MSNEVNIDGPYAFKDVDGLVAPAYIYKPGGEKKFVGTVAVKVQNGMKFEVDLDEEYKDLETASFEVPMRFTYFSPDVKPKINWGYNCLTGDVHHGRQEAIWRMPLLQAKVMFGESLKPLVLERIRQDAEQYVENSPFVQKVSGATHVFTQAWADRLVEIAEEKFDDLFAAKVDEITEYYDSASWRRDMENMVEWYKEYKLNANYQPLHSHDTVNMLCRILACSSERDAGPIGA